MTKFEVSGLATISGRGKIVHKSNLAQNLYLVEFADKQQVYAYLPTDSGFVLLEPDTEVFVQAVVKIALIGPAPRKPETPEVK